MGGALIGGNKTYLKGGKDMTCKGMESVNHWMDISITMSAVLSFSVVLGFLLYNIVFWLLKGL